MAEFKEVVGPDGIKFWVYPNDSIKAVGSQGDLYDVDIDAGTCSCDGFRFSRTDPQSCKHSRSASIIDWEERTR